MPNEQSPKASRNIRAGILLALGIAFALSSACYLVKGILLLGTCYSFLTAPLISLLIASMVAIVAHALIALALYHHASTPNTINGATLADLLEDLHTTRNVVMSQAKNGAQIIAYRIADGDRLLEAAKGQIKGKTLYTAVAMCVSSFTTTALIASFVSLACKQCISLPHVEWLVALGVSLVLLLLIDCAIACNTAINFTKILRSKDFSEFAGLERQEGTHEASNGSLPKTSAESPQDASYSGDSTNSNAAPKTDYGTWNAERPFHKEAFTAQEAQ